jgi:hypothetical protein
MSQESSGPPTNDLPPPQAADGERRVRDRRAPWKMWIPTYVLRYLDQVGSHGLTLYALLAWHCTRDAPCRWPSLNQLARLMAVSRSTVERTMRVLRATQLIETIACLDATGQKSNYFDLIDPPAEREQSGSHGAPAAGAVTGEGAPPSWMKGGDVTGEGGAPSQATAPSGYRNEILSVCEEGDTHTPSAAPAPEGPGGEIAELCARWIAHLPPGAPGWRSAQEDEIRWAVELLLSRGWTKEQLTTSITDPARDCGEWPRVWAQRLGPRPPQPSKTPSSPLIERQRRAEEAQKVKESWETPEGRAVAEEWSRRFAQFTGKKSLLGGTAAEE